MAEKRIVDINPVLEELKADLLDHESCCEPLTLAEAMKDEIEDLEKLPIIDPESLRGHAKWVKDKELKFIIVDDENDSHEEPAICCTHCKAKISQSDFDSWVWNFCPVCGFKMEDET